MNNPNLSTLTQTLEKNEETIKLLIQEELNKHFKSCIEHITKTIATREKTFFIFIYIMSILLIAQIIYFQFYKTQRDRDVLLEANKLIAFANTQQDKINKLIKTNNKPTYSQEYNDDDDIHVIDDPNPTIKKR